MLNEWSQTPFTYIQKNFYPQGISDQKLSVWLHFQNFKPAIQTQLIFTMGVYNEYCKDLQPSDCSKADWAAGDVWPTAMYGCNLNHDN